MSEAPIKQGDTVRLKSGGPMMIVKALEGDEAVAIWFEGSYKQEKRFRLADLKRDDGSQA
jgi:uncharacterized protein YodC (DUF2158 family)